MSQNYSVAGRPEANKRQVPKILRRNPNLTSEQEQKAVIQVSANDYS